MTWLYIIIIAIVLLICFVLVKNKGKNQNNDDNLTPEEQDVLDEDYLRHGTRKNTEDQENI